MNPDYAEAHRWYAEYLAYMGRHEESLAEAHLAKRLDPLSLGISYSLGLMFYEARQFGRAIEEYQTVLRADPNFVIARNYLGLAYAGNGMYEEALAEVERAVDLSDGQVPLYTGTLGFVYASMGRVDAAESVLEALLAASSQRYVAPVSLAIIYGALGRMDEAFEWMEMGFDVRDDYLMVLQVDPRLDSLRPDPRFRDLIRRMKLPE